MHPKPNLLITLFVFSFYAALGYDNLPTGGRQAGLGNATVTLSDVWATNYNQAGLARIEKMTAGIYYDNRYITNTMSLKAAAFAMPVQDLGVFGVSVSHFGYSLYSEQKIGVSYARNFGPSFSAGVQLNYLGTSLPSEYGSRGAICAEAGLQFEIVKNLRMGAHIFNINRARMANYNQERIPTIMKLGLAYTFSEKVMVTAEAEKDIEQKPMIKGGVEYRIAKPLYLRTGISTNPTLNTFGIGVLMKDIRFDFAMGLHPELGLTPHLSLVYDFK
jgi:hypothetical protein